MLNQLPSNHSDSLLEDRKDDDGKEIIDQDIRNIEDEDSRILREAASVLNEITGDWSILNDEKEATFPRFDESGKFELEKNYYH